MRAGHAGRRLFAGLVTAGMLTVGLLAFSASKVFQGIRVNDVDIDDSTYGGVSSRPSTTGAGTPSSR